MVPPVRLVEPPVRTRARYARGDRHRPRRCPPGTEHVWSYGIRERECRNCQLVEQ